MILVSLGNSIGKSIQYILSLINSFTDIVASSELIDMWKFGGVVVIGDWGGEGFGRGRASVGCR